MTFMPLHDPLGLRQAVLCWRFETESDQPVQHAAIRDADLRTLLDDLNDNRTRRGLTEQDCADPDVVHYRIVGVNAWGDRLSVDGYCGVFDLSGSNSAVSRPNAGSQAILDRLVARNPTVIAAPDRYTPPDQVIAIWADLLNGGDHARAAKLWVDPPHIPTGVTIQVKTEEVRSVQAEPQDTAAGYRDLVEATSLFRLVPTDGSRVDYHHVRFTLGRVGAGRPWRVLKMTDEGLAPTGR